MIEDKTWKYSFSELREFITRGREHGDVGCIPIKRENGMTLYRGYGTIENPCRELRNISMMYNPVMDDHKYIIPAPEYNFMILDFSATPPSLEPLG